MKGAAMDRRHFLTGASLGALGLSACAGWPGAPSSGGRVLDPEVEDLQERTFRWFVDTTNRANGLTPDRWPKKTFASIAAVGFALTCWPIGVERGWMTREEARARTLITARFFHDAPQGPEPTGVTGHKGFFYHFLDMETGLRYRDTELSTVDTTLLLGGLLYAAQWFDGDHPDEAEIRRLAQAVYERVDWSFAVVRPNRISMGWRPERGFERADWNRYNEGMLVLLLAMGSPTHPLPGAVWEEWMSVYDQSWTDEWGPAHLHFAPLFGHQYSHMFVDFRGIHDAFMRGKQAGIPGFDYFQNSVRAVQAQRNYAIRNPMGWAGYSADVWGLTACDGPGDFRQVIDGHERQFFSYSARGPGERDDGTLAPTAALGAMPFAPAEVTACLKAMKARYGAGIYAEYGFLDAFNPTLAETDQTLQHGRIVPGVGWVDGDYLGIDQGPIVIQIENHRSDAVWKRMRGEPNLIRGLKRAGFGGGWLDRA
ncbi:glucoamylase family protein [uncultured Brevundimonas sp.]|uniref:glucoamylase family protein n=1 Tax=uncultured Brevundimonas sp. TaxID=213418 RepID=UPI00260C9A3B|nr:glucoamylase family protein [uncultured Brevundimonas sp.]